MKAWTYSEDGGHWYLELTKAIAVIVRRDGSRFRAILSGIATTVLPQYGAATQSEWREVATLENIKGPIEHAKPLVERWAERTLRVSLMVIVETEYAAALKKAKVDRDYARNALLRAARKIRVTNDREKRAERRKKLRALAKEYDRVSDAAVGGPGFTKSTQRRINSLRRQILKLNPNAFNPGTGRRQW